MPSREEHVSVSMPAREQAASVAPWAVPAHAVAEALRVDVERGLSEDEVTRRRARHGPNQLRRHQRQSVWHILVEQFKSLIVALLVVAAAVAFLAGAAETSRAVCWRPSGFW